MGDCHCSARRNCGARHGDVSRLPDRSRKSRQSKVAHAARAPTPLLRHRRRKFACSFRSTGLAGGSGPPSRRLDGVGDLPDQRRLSEAFEVIDDIAIYRHPLPPEGRGALAYFREYSTALFHEFRLLFKVHRERGFSIIQACNPPDLIFLAALPFKLMGKRFIFDQHDVSPELFVVKFGNKGFLYRALMFFERMSYAMADHVITANATFKDIAVSRGGKAPSQVEVVYGVPDRKRIRRVEPEPGLHGGRKFVLGYLGIINEQDGVDHLVRAVAHLVKVKGFRDFRAVVVGSGPALELVRALARSLEVEDFILFTGYLKRRDAARVYQRLRHRRHPRSVE